jgi:hypothetical protein
LLIVPEDLNAMQPGDEAAVQVWRLPED